MKPHHVLILAATLIFGAGMYAAFSTPIQPTGGLMRRAVSPGSLSVVLPLVAAGVAIWFVATFGRGDFQRRSRLAIRTLLAIAAALGLVAAGAAASMSAAAPVAQSAVSESEVTFEPTAGSKATVTLSRTVPSGSDRTHLVFATSFSAGVALLAAITLAFLRLESDDERGKPAPVADIAHLDS